MSDFVAQLIVGVVVLLFLCFGTILLLLRSGKRVLRLLLGSFFIVLGFAVLDVNAQITGFYFDHPNFAYWLHALPLLFGPLIYLITKSGLYQGHRMPKKDYLHFLPSGIVFGISLIAYHPQSHDMKITILREANEPGVWSNLLVSLFLFGTIAIYLVLSLKMLRRYRQALLEQYSSTDHKMLRWLDRLIYGFTAIIFFTIVIQITSFSTQNRNWVAWLCLVLVLMLLAQIFYNVFLGLQESKLFAGLASPNTAVPLATSTRVSQEEVQRVSDHLTNAQSYLEPDLTLADLAAQLSYSPRELSSLINTGLAENFFDLINRHRIEHAKALLTDGQDVKRTVMEVMYASGFNSKSSFNTAFKRRCIKCKDDEKSPLGYARGPVIAQTPCFA